MKTNFSNHIGYFLQEVARKSAISLNDELKAMDITYAQFRVINCLFKRGPLSQKEILKIICVTPATLTGTVDILEKKNLVYREAELEDARTKKIHLTSAGAALQREAWTIVENYEKKTTDFLTKEERELILKSLREMEKRL